jgi:hypothetical protein
MWKIYKIFFGIGLVVASFEAFEFNFGAIVISFMAFAFGLSLIAVSAAELLRKIAPDKTATDAEDPPQSPTPPTE